RRARLRRRRAEPPARPRHRARGDARPGRARARRAAAPAGAARAGARPHDAAALRARGRLPRHPPRARGLLADDGEEGRRQALPAEAAACVYWLVDLKPVLERYGNRGYRAAQLEAALEGGKSYLAAYALRLGATGLTFFDDDVTRFFSPHAAGKSVMFLMAF